MNCPGYEFLARSSFSDNQDSGVRRGNAGDLVAYFLDFSAVSEDSVGPDEIANGGLEELILADQIRALTSAPHGRPDNLRIERLCDEIKGSLPHALDSKLNGRDCGEEDYGQRSDRSLERPIELSVRLHPASFGL